MSGPNLNKLPKSDNEQIPSEGLLTLVKTRPVDFGINSADRYAALLSFFTSRILPVLWSGNCDLHPHRIKIPQKPFFKKQKKFWQPANFQKLNNQDLAKIDNRIPTAIKMITHKSK